MVVLSRCDIGDGTAYSLSVNVNNVVAIDFLANSVTVVGGGHVLGR